MTKNAIAIIPARGGSKRIPKKNIKIFHGKPLIAYSIETALKSDLFQKVIVSTDCKEIANISKKYGAQVPFLRPKELSDDFTGSGEAVDYTINRLKEQGEEYKYVCTIYATAPFLTTFYLKKGYEKIIKDTVLQAFSCASMPYPVQRTFKINQNGRCEMFWPEYFDRRSQDLEEAYHDAGQFYWTNITFISNKKGFNEDMIPIVMPRHLVQDIDTMEDWVNAELKYKILKEANYV